MISHCIKRFWIRSETSSIRVQCRDFVGQYIAKRFKTTGPNDESDPTRMLLELCVDGYYVAPGPVHTDLFQRGMCCNYGPLGVELKKNLLEQWWSSIKRSRTQVFGISTLTTGDGKSSEGDPSLDVERLNQLLDADELSKAQRIQRILMLLRQSTPLRTNLLQGRAQPASCEAMYLTISRE